MNARLGPRAELVSGGAVRSWRPAPDSTAPRTSPLTGPPVEAAWDMELTPAMESLGVAPHEEAALDLLLKDLG
ncbi:DUF2399 domain-containing protein [Streptomyces pseudogriseolus]|uniref:DUF2399 domain-containing protein n=1 Tax=Streptomyces pseudogriseolus TaxID=36817 RepID=UPI003FA1EADB